MYRTIIAETELEKKMFLSLPGKLYKKTEIVQDKKTEKQLLEGTHCLSKKVRVIPLLAVDANGNAVARCVVSLYEEDDNAYVGFYECIPDFAAAKVLLSAAMDMVISYQKKKLIGPIDVSFWIGYRFKADHYEKHYSGEPYNKEYYIEQWESCGFAVSDRYYSNQYKIVEKGYYNKKYQARLKKFEEQGIEMVIPTNDSFERHLIAVYPLLVKLYSSFPGFQWISEEEFVELFTSLKYVMNYRMVRLVYAKKKLVGFFISIPNYGNLVNNINLIKLLKIMKIKKCPKEYIMLYMGVDSEYLGLGAALAEVIKTQLSENGATSIGALIHEGKVSGIYYKDLITDQYHYVLLEKQLPVKSEEIVS